VCACGKIEERKNIASLSVEFVKVGRYDFPYSYYGPQNSYLSFKQPLVDTEFDMADVPHVEMDACIHTSAYVGLYSFTAVRYFVL
jgi:hypothetical protein